MRKAIIITCLIGSALLVLASFNVVDSLTLFLLAGVIPGTDYRIPAIDMMSATATAITVIILRITLWPRIKAGLLSRVDTPSASPAKKRTLKRVV